MKYSVIFALIPLILSIGITPVLSFDFIPIAEGYGGGGGGGQKPDTRVCGEKLCSEIPGGRNAWETRNILDTEVSYEKNDYVDSPKKQMKGGVAAKGVICKSGLTLMIRISGDAVCVKPTSAEKLTVAGFGTIQPESTMNESMLTAEEAQSIAEEAYIFGYPLILMDLTLKKMSNVPEAGENRSPINQFVHYPEFPDHNFKDVVKPNADTLYSSAWLDLADEPIILHVPNTDDRYYLMPLLDAWTNVFESPGKRTTGNEANDFAIVGPFWDGVLPEDVTEVQSPTEMVWILGRTQANGVTDFDAVITIQEQYTLTPLSSFGESYFPPQNVDVDSTIDMITPPVTKIEQADTNVFFDRMAILMKANPFAPEDADLVAKFEKIGLIPGEGFDSSSLDPKIVDAIELGAKEGLEKIKSNRANVGIKENGWQKSLDLGSYGTNYLLRATTAFLGLGANLVEDAIYPMAYVDSNGDLLHGSNNYVIHFPNEQTPPVNAFWSLTMYGEDEFFVENPIDLYAIGDRNELEYNEDGSLDIYIQHDSPEGKESNWLPAPEDDFNVTMRIYWPQESVSDGTWEIPAIELIK